MVSYTELYLSKNPRRGDGLETCEMALERKKLLVCDCEGTMALDGKALAKACGLAEPFTVHTQLCRRQVESFRAALGGGEPVIVACTQEAPLFAEVATETAPDAALAFTNIREQAGWSEEARDALPKMAALLAEAGETIEPAGSVTMHSNGVCLVYGRDEAAIEAARQLAARLDVTLLLAEADELLPPPVMDVPIFKGRIVAARGHLGAFEITVDGYAPMAVSSRDGLRFEAPRNGAASKCELILDLTGGPPLFPAAERRDGYFRVDPKHPAAVQRALFDLTDLVGDFDKPRYVAFDAGLCAHSRSRKTGCTRCLEVCPTSAIRPDGDVVAIDPFICGGCGACHSVCPTGAASYALPPAAALLNRLRTLLMTYGKAGGSNPVLLVHDTRRGAEAIGLIARAGRGLPARVLPFAVNEVTQIGFEFLAAALAYGATQILLLAAPSKAGELDGLAAQVGMAETLMSGLGFGGGRVQVVMEADPEAIERLLYALPAMEPARPGNFLPMGGKRAVIGLALTHLHGAAPAPVETLPLAPGAPFGQVVVDVAGCTLCLACVGACPTSALKDNPEKPQLSFEESACIQCGLCQNTCPEHVIRLEPRFSFAPAAQHAAVIKEEEPFHCVRCGKPFGIKSTVERILGKLAEKHWMFQNTGAIERIKMCDDCRVVSQFEAGGDPFAGPPRPIPRSTDDYLREREIEEARAKVRAERGKGGGDKS